MTFAPANKIPLDQIRSALIVGNKRVTQTSDSRSWTPSDDVGDHMFNTVHAIKGLHFTYQLSAIRHGIHSKKGGSTQINMYISRYKYGRYILRRLVPIETFEDTQRYGGSLRDPKEGSQKSTTLLTPILTPTYINGR